MTATTTIDAAQLLRVRRGVRAALTLGVAASLAANVLHAEPTGVGRVIAAWPPLALLLTVELISRVPVHRPGLAAIRFAATTAIAGIAAWVSYWHMVSVCARYGETLTSAHLIPLSVDGLVVVASVCLVEIGGRLRTTIAAQATHSETDTTPSIPDTESATPVAGPTNAVPVSADIAPHTVPDSPADTGRTAARTSNRTPKRTARPDTASAARKLRDRHPDMPTVDIARRLGVTDRTVRRHLNTATTAATADATPLPTAA